MPTMSRSTPPMVPLGYGKFVRADRVYALVPLEAPARGDGRRTLVYVEGIDEPVGGLPVRGRDRRGARRGAGCGDAAGSAGRGRHAGTGAALLRRRSPDRTPVDRLELPPPDALR